MRLTVFVKSFQKSNPNRVPSTKTHVSVFGLPIEAKPLVIGKIFEQMGYGRHVYTKPVMRTTPVKGTPYYTGILVAVMENMPQPMSIFMNVLGYRVRVKHNGQETRTKQKSNKRKTIGYSPGGFDHYRCPNRHCSPAGNNTC